MPSLQLSDLVAHRLPEQTASVVVGFSGGLDSTVLLHLLHALSARCGFSLRAVHVHHGLSPNADAWAAHCTAFCQSLGIPLEIARVHLDLAGQGIEAAAREARHAVFAHQQADRIALAHHADDQAETVLLRMLRGAGVRGAGAMAERDDGRRLWRPLLDVPRARLLTHARSHGLVWIEDESNADIRFSRNFLRTQVMPPVLQHWPAAVTNLSRFAVHLREADELLVQLATIDRAEVRPGEPASRDRLRAMPPARARNLLRVLLDERAAGMPTAARLDDALRQLCGAASAVHVPLDDVVLCAYRDAFWLEASVVALPAAMGWHGEARLDWVGGSLLFSAGSGAEALRLDTHAGVSVGLRQPGDRLRLRAGGPSRTLRQWMQEAGVPPWWRERIPVLRDAAGRLLWVPFLGADAHAVCAEGEAGWRVEWLPDGATVNRP